MQLKFLRAAAVGLLIASTSAAWAQGNSAVAPEKMEAARDLLEATRADAQFAAIIPLLFRQMRQGIPSPGPNHLEEVNKVFAEIEKQFLARRKEVIDQIAVLYARKFTAEEMSTLANFYRTPIGQKFIDATPELATEAMRIGHDWGQDIARDAEQTIRNEFKRRGLKL